MNPRLVGVVATALLGYSLFGYDTGVVSGGIVLIAKDFGLTWYERELCVVVTNLLAALAAAVGGPLGDRLGRKRVMEAAALFFMLGPAISAMAPSYPILMLGRALLGVGVGLSFVVVPIYVSEATPEQVRGQLVDLADFVVVAGQLAAGLVNGAAESLPNISWRGSVGFASVIAALQFAMLRFSPESPRWLMAKGMRGQAVDVLRELHAGDGKEAEVAVEREAAAILEALERERRTDTSIWCTKRVQRALMVGVMLQVLNQLTGINTVMYYGATILEHAGFEESAAVWLACLCDFAQLVGVCIQISIIDTMGRRFTGLSSTTGVTITLALLGLSFAAGKGLSWLCVAALMAYLVAFGSGLSGVPYVMNAEIHPLEIRVQCNAIAGVANWTLNLVVGSTFPIILHYVGAHYAFFSYAVVGLLGIGWMWRYLPETAHVPLEAIGAFFEDPYPNPRWAGGGCKGLGAESGSEASGASGSCSEDVSD